MSTEPVMIWKDGEVVPAPEEFLAQREADQAAYEAGATDRLRAYARDVSWRKRISGAPIDGLHVATDPDSLTLIVGMEGLARAQPERVFNFDTAAGPITLTSEQAIAFAVEVATFVQSTFDKRAEVLAEIDSGDITTREEVDAAFSGL